MFLHCLVQFFIFLARKSAQSNAAVLRLLPKRKHGRMEETAKGLKSMEIRNLINNIMVWEMPCEVSWSLFYVMFCACCRCVAAIVWINTDTHLGKRAAMHPFGREEQSSVQDLFVFFTQCLQHGEWELAAACVRQLSQATGDVAQHPDDVIAALIAQPYQLAWVLPTHILTAAIKLLFRLPFSFTCVNVLAF